ncbi:hypothetical protein M2168_002172 [Streptomyces sp. CZ24]|nr:PIN domain-containing protein [Streptomyces sp. CZ24]MDH6189140.1 hypothetical protein [Streptomyces sp. CZ24]
MIILDSNILWDIKPDDPMADLLRVLRSTGTQKVAVPWLVLEELVGQQAIKYREKQERLIEAKKAVEEVSPWQRPHYSSAANPPPPIRLETCRRHWRGVYTDIVDVIPTSEGALREGAFREMNALAPCKKGQKGKTNFRDAVIWMSAVEYARENPTETVYFISKNTTDFGDGTSYQYPMADDIEQFGERFVHLTDGDEIVKRFTTQVSADVDEVATLVNSKRTRDELSSLALDGAMENRRVRRGFPVRPLSADDGFRGSRRATAWLPAPQVVFNSVRDIRAFGIGDHVWCTARVRWIVGGYAFDEIRNTVTPAACAWETLVLTSTSSPQTGTTLLRSEGVTEATEEESHCLTFDRWDEDPVDGHHSDPATTLERAIRRLSMSIGGIHHLPPRARRELDELRAEEGDI